MTEQEYNQKIKDLQKKIYDQNDHVLRYHSNMSYTCLQNELEILGFLRTQLDGMQKARDRIRQQQGT